MPHERISVSGQARDAYEIALLCAFLAAGKPIFGICRGMQLINVLLGGTLWEDLPMELANDAHMDGQMHEIVMREDSWLFPLFGEHFGVNSYHHQACRCLASGLVASAHAPDGLIEAFCHERLPIYGVQWHPERMYVPGEKDVSEMQKLFVFWKMRTERPSD